jgi:hypothetical protein
MNKKVVLDLTINKDQIKVSDEYLYGYVNIRKVTIAKEVLVLPIAAFRNRKQLTKVYFEPHSMMKKIPDHCFDRCDQLKKINNLPENLVTIGDKAFAFCSAIERIEIPESVEYVSPSAFDGWQLHQTIKMYKKFTLSSLCKANIEYEIEDILKTNRIITRNNDETLKPYIVKAKCGHVSRQFYIEIDFPIMAKNGKEAAAIARQRGRVKHDHRFAILSVRIVTQEEFDEQVDINRQDPYLKVRSKHEQREIWDQIKHRLIPEPNPPGKR